MGAARLFRFRRAHLRAGDARVLRARAPVGQRGSSRRDGLKADLPSPVSSAVSGALRFALDSLFTVVLAPPCASCGELLEQPTGGPVCVLCWSRVLPLTPPLCDCCGEPLPTWRQPADGTRCARCRRQTSAVSRARAIGAYEDPLRAIVH